MASITNDKAREIQELAHFIRSQATVKNPTYMARLCNADISFIDMNGEPPAFCRPTQTLGEIYISNFVDKFAQEVLCAHELGHLLIHRNHELCLFDTEIGPIEEYEANLFAFYLYPRAFARLDTTRLHSVEYVNQFVKDLVSKKIYL